MWKFFFNKLNLVVAFVPPSKNSIMMYDHTFKALKSLCMQCSKLYLLELKKLIVTIYKTSLENWFFFYPINNAGLAE